jgi:ArsR family transcriptional regulator, zinc-responsive transcriptional repressor
LNPVDENPFDAKVDELVELFKLLADPTRVKILILLAGGERNVTTLCNVLKLPQPTVSHHLSLLRQFGVIANRRDGKQVFYQLDGRVDRNTHGVLGLDAGEYKLRITQPEDVIQQSLKN